MTIPHSKCILGTPGFKTWTLWFSTYDDHQKFDFEFNRLDGYVSITFWMWELEIDWPTTFYDRD